MAVSIFEEIFSSVKKIKFEWVSDAEGAASGTTSWPFTGVLQRLVTIPGTDEDQPTDQYDIVINDEDGVDALAGAGGNRSNVSTEQVLAGLLGTVANDKLTLVVSNAGALKSGTTILYLR